jgi:hypothetical protein
MLPNTGLNVSDFVRTSVTLSPSAALYRNFGVAAILGSTPGIIDTNERLRYYSSLEGVQLDFPVGSPEVIAATTYFSQDPQPNDLYIGRWAQNPTHGHIRGATLSPTQSLVSNFNTIANGSLKIQIDGTVQTVTGIDLTTALNNNGVASRIQTALAAVAAGTTVIWNASYRRFEIASGTTGPTSNVGYAQASATGTDLGPLLHLTSIDAGAPVVGQVAESFLSAAAALAAISNAWYALIPASVTPPTDSDLVAVASMVEALSASQSRIFGVTLQNANVLDIANDADDASTFMDLGLSRTFSQYSSGNAYAAASLFGRIATVNYEGSNTAITLAYKQEPNVPPENINENQFSALKSKNCNAFVKVRNNTQIVFPGIMANGDYIDERVGMDWFQNRLQTDCYNLLYETPTKIPQTNDGMTQIKTTIAAACQVGVVNGLFTAGGIWTGPPVGTLKTGDTLTTGFYIYAPDVATLSDADRAARISVPFQICVKLGDAVHIINMSAYLDR